jgi:hypothetical protein
MAEPVRSVTRHAKKKAWKSFFCRGAVKAEAGLSGTVIHDISRAVQVRVYQIDRVVEIRRAVFFSVNPPVQAGQE